MMQDLRNAGMIWLGACSKWSSPQTLAAMIFNEWPCVRFHLGRPAGDPDWRGRGKCYCHPASRRPDGFYRQTNAWLDRHHLCGCCLRPGPTTLCRYGNPVLWDLTTNGGQNKSEGITQDNAQPKLRALFEVKPTHASKRPHHVLIANGKGQNGNGNKHQRRPNQPSRQIGMPGRRCFTIVTVR